MNHLQPHKFHSIILHSRINLIQFNFLLIFSLMLFGWKWISFPELIEAFWIRIPSANLSIITLKWIQTKNYATSDSNRQFFSIILTCERLRRISSSDFRNWRGKMNRMSVSKCIQSKGNKNSPTQKLNYEKALSLMINFSFLPFQLLLNSSQIPPSHYSCGKKQHQQQLISFLPVVSFAFLVSITRKENSHIK